MPDQAGRRGPPRRVTAGLCAVLLLLQVGCHTFLPLQESAPVPRTQVAVVLNDRGRVLVGDRLGQTIDRIEGVLMESSESEVKLQVARTVTLQGSSTIWQGEEVVLSRDGVRGFQPRQYSRGRTVMLVIGAIAGVGILAGAITLLVGGGGKPRDGSGCVPPDCQPQ